MMEAMLQEGLAQLGLPTDGVPALIRYAGLLAEWNEVMDLTAITDPADVVRLHFLDSAALLGLEDFRGKRVVDVGTGAGFPGLPLRILEPSVRLTLLDAQNKRVNFLREVCRTLALEDVECVHGRAEEFARGRRGAFDLAVSRAVAYLPVLAEPRDYRIPGTGICHRLVVVTKTAQTPAKYPRAFAKIKKDPL